MMRRPSIASDSTIERSPVSCMPRVAARRIEPPSRSIAQATAGSASSDSRPSCQSLTSTIAEIDHQLHQLQKDGGDALGQRIAHQGGVVEKVGNELAGMHGVEIGQIAADQPAEHVALGLGHRFLAQRVDQHAAEEQAGGAQRHDAERRQRQRQQQSPPCGA